MPHEVGLITTIAAALGLALVLGFVAARLRLPPLVGYLIAGILLGPATPGFVADVELTQELAEIGVMLMMFGVGLHFSLGDLMSVRRIAVPGALVQTATATVLGAGIAMLWGWEMPSAVVFGLSLSVASTVVLLRALEARGRVGSLNGRIAVGWLVVEDLIVVFILVLLPALAGEGTSLLGPLAVTLAKVAAFAVVMLALARRLLPTLLWQVASVGSRELFTLAVVSAAVGVAYLSAMAFSVSFALGAFFAGMMMRESALSHRAAEESLPLRDAFSVLFFVSVGMLFDPDVLLSSPFRVALVVGVIMIGKTVAAVALVLAFRYPLNTALTVGAGLAQIGEFSFILAGLGVDLGLITLEAQSLIVAGALASISLNPLMFAAVEPGRDWIVARSAAARALELRDDPLAELPRTVDPAHLTGHVLIVGYGRVGRRIAEALERERLPFVVAEENRELVEGLRARGAHAVAGDAAEAAVLIQAHVARARMLVIAAPDTLKARRMVDLARTLNPTVEVLIRTHSDEEADLMRRENLGAVYMGEHELATAMAGHVLTGMREAANPPAGPRVGGGDRT